MATIIIKDLPESATLDHQAMVAIVGGARTRARQSFPTRQLTRSARIVDYPTSVPRYSLADTNGRSAATKSIK